MIAISGLDIVPI